MTQDAAGVIPRDEQATAPTGSLRTRLIISNAIITIVAVAAMGVYVFYRGEQSSGSLARQLEAGVRQQAESQLTANADSQVAALNAFFSTIRGEIADAGAGTSALLSEQPRLGQSQYWSATDSLVQLKTGSWDNFFSGPASVFIPAGRELTDALVSELNTLKQLDFSLPQKLRAHPDVVAIYFGGTSGETLYYPDIDLAAIVPPDFDVTQRPWYVKAAPEQNPARRAVWSDPYLDAALHGLVITSSTPVFDSANTFRGVIAMDIQLGRIADLVSNIHAGQTGYAFLVDRDKRLIAISDSGYRDLGITAEQVPLGNSLDPSQLPAPLPAGLDDLLTKMSAGQSGLETISLGGIDRFAAYRPVPEVGYSMVIIVPSSELLSGAIAAREQLAQASANTTQFSLVLVAIILALGILATVVLGNSFVAPLSALTRTAQEIRAGNLAARAGIRSRDEIGILSQTLNTMTDNVQELVTSLEQRVKERTAALELATREASRRAAQFEAITRATAAISSVRNLDELLPVVASVISEQFGYYHVGIFFNDESSEVTRLIAANSEGGRRMLERRHSLKIGEQGIVGYVAARGQPRVAHRVGEDAVFFRNPDLPGTRAEAALPLRGGDRTIGVLDVQSTEEQAFTPEDLSILGILADQVSLAIENARLFDTTRRSLSETESLYRQYLREAWQGTPREPQVTGFRFDGQRAFALHEGDQATEVGRPGAEREGDVAAEVDIPIQLRGETIGQLHVRRSDETPWTQDQVELMQAVAQRVALSAENARLFEETGRRAERERLVTEITSKIRQSNDPGEMMQTALEELRRALGATNVQVIPHSVRRTAKGEMRSAPRRTKVSRRNEPAGGQL